MLNNKSLLYYVENEMLKLNNIDYKCFKNNSIILTNKNSKDSILLIHGFNSSPINWLVHGVEFYKNNYDVYLYSVPGFSSPIEKYILKKPNDELIDYYNEKIKLFILEYNIKPHLIGHSFGGFLAINFALKYPDYIKTLIPINTIGIINLTNKNQYINILLFKSKLVNNFIKKIFFLILIICNMIIIKKKQFSIKFLKKIHIFLNICRKDYYGHDIITKFISIEPLNKIYWNKLLLKDMLTNNLPPITFIWSLNDNFIPYYIPLLFVKLLEINNKNHPKIIILPFNNHSFSIDDAKLLYINIISAIKIATTYNPLIKS